jgi:glycerate-2-kinase
MIARALKAVDAGAAVRRAVVRQGDVLIVGARRYDLRRYDRVVVVGAGKATAAMACAIERLLGRRVRDGLVIVKYGHAVPTKRIVVKEAGHPLPDQAGLRAARRLRDLAGALGPRDLLIVLLSGGASSLMPAPVHGVSLSDKQRITRLLLRSGARIDEINTVRKHLSDLKGGRLVEATRATVVTLILSDVLGDDLSAIASGPTVPDPTTYGDAVACLKRYGLWSLAPQTVRAHLNRGLRGLVPETPKPGSARFRRVHHHVVGNLERAIAAVTGRAREAELRTVVHSVALTGEARVEGARFGALARSIVRTGNPVRPPCCVVAGGETTVTVTGGGKGGRAQEFAVAAALEIDGLENVWVMAVGTDGTDGPTDVAGAVVNGATVGHASRLGIDLASVLKRNDTYPVLKRLRCHITTGPTGTNVNDLYLLLAL